jgi:UDP-2,3-diacylglucosamine pyrophosphatase LpxH
MSSSLPQHAAVHVISDIHMGGAPGFQILRETQRLAGYVQRLAAQRPGQSVALVLNGDVFDTLAEDLGQDYVATHQAVAVLSRIMDDPSFQPIWDAFARFVQTADRKLVFVIGNHDIEMAFPPVQRLLVQRLAGDDPLARGRIEFSTTGAGYLCTVGHSKVFCTHGNEFDEWNYNRYEDLARVGRRLNCDQPIDPQAWKPNAGTKMVKEVMNEVKRRYRWIDLLKPETSAALGTLLAIDTSQVKRLSELPDILEEKIIGKEESEGRLSAPASASPIRAAGDRGTPIARLEALLGSNLRGAQAPVSHADDMLLAADPTAAGASQVHAEGTEGMLGTGQLIWDRLTGWLTGVKPEEALRRALQDWLRNDKTFDLDDRDDTCLRAVKNIGASVDVIVTGHTHLARAIELGGGRLYFNSGTWIRLMKFTDAMLADEAAFAPVHALLKKGDLAAIDAATFADQPFVLNDTTEVELTMEGTTLVGRLNRIEGDGSAAPCTIATLPKA